MKKKSLFKIFSIFTSLSVATIIGGTFLATQNMVAKNNLKANSITTFADSTATSTTTPTNTSSANLSDYNFFNTSALKDRINTQNVENIYNINGSSLLYANKKSSTPLAVDSIVSVKDIGNSVNWALDSENMINIIKASRAKKTSLSANVPTAVVLNKAEYSVSSNQYFLNVYATDSTGPTKGATVILKIHADTGVATVYYDALQATESKFTPSGGSSSFNYKNVNFSQFVIKQDNNVSPTLLLIQSEYYNTNGYNTFTALSVQGSSSGPGDIDGGIIASATSNGFVQAETNHMATAGNKLLVTSSKWLNNGLFLLFQYKTSTATAASPKTVAYGFSFRGNTIQSPFSTEVSRLTNSTLDTFYNIWQKGNETFLVARQKPSVGSTFADQGAILVQKLDMVIDANNVNISVSNDIKQIKYFNVSSLVGITETYNKVQLPNNASYVAISQNNVLVSLSNQFEYLSQIAMVEVPSSVSVINIKTVGLNYLVYLSNGEILVYNNAGYVGTSRSLLDNSLELPGRVAFKDQNDIVNGAQFFALGFENFKNIFPRNLSSFLTVNPAYQNTNPLLSYEYVSKPITGKDYSNEITIKVFQDLRSLNANGTVNTTLSTTTTKVYLGEQTYRFFTDPAVVSPKRFTDLPPALQKIVPSEIAALYPKNQEQLIKLLLDVSKINLYDKNGENSPNATISLTANDALGRLDITLSVAYVNESNNAIPRQFNVTINGFSSTNVQSDQLNYDLNPVELPTLQQKYSKISPKDLPKPNITNDFIKLSPFLTSQNYKITTVANEEKGTVIFTIVFDFQNPFLKLGQNPKAIQVTRNSITWESEPVFASNNTLNEELLIKFNTLSEISATETGQRALVLTPTKLQAELEAKSNVKQKVDAIIEWGFVTLSDYVAKNISEVLIINPNDIMGEFTLQIILKNALSGSLSSNYAHDFSGFAKIPSRGENLFSVNFLTKEQYLSKYSVNEENNIFNLVPSSVEASDLMERSGTSLSPNGILGGLVSMSENALNSQFTFNLTPDNLTGKLLVTIVFNSFIELADDGTTKITNNKKIIYYYDGFKQTTENGIYFLNWNSPEKVQENVTNSKSTFSGLKLSEIQPSEFVKALDKTSDINKLGLFADLSKEAFRKYKNADSSGFNISFIPNDEKGTLTVNANFSEWNFGPAIIPFSQTFSGFKIPTEFVAEQIQNYDPLKSEFTKTEGIEKIKQTYRPSELTPEILANFYSFENNILNSKDKVIYFIYDDSIGKGFLMFFVKTASNNANVATTSGFVTQQIGNTKIVMLSATSGDGDLKDKKIEDFDISKVPVAQLEAQGFQKMGKSNTLLEGFQSFKLESNRLQSIIALSLAILLPLLILLPIAIYVFKHRNKNFISYVQKQISTSLGRRKRREEERGKLDE